MEREVKAIAKTRQIGGSLVITLPVSIVKTEQLEEGQWIEFKIKKHKRDYFGALKGIGKFTKEDRAKGQLDDE